MNKSRLSRTDSVTLFLPDTTMGKHLPVQIICPGALWVYSQIRSEKYRSVRKYSSPPSTEVDTVGVRSPDTGPQCLSSYPSIVTMKIWSRRNISQRRSVRLTQLLEKSVSQCLDTYRYSCNYNALYTSVCNPSSMEWAQQAAVFTSQRPTKAVESTDSCKSAYPILSHGNRKIHYTRVLTEL